MLRIYAEQFVKMGRLFTGLRAFADLRMVDATVPLNQELVEALLKAMGELQQQFEVLELRTSQDILQQSCCKFREKNVTALLVQSEIEFLDRTATSELGNRLFLFIPPERARYHWAGVGDPAKVPFNTSYLTKFPDALADMRAACNCYSVGEFTASVFHLMRMAELALRELATELNITNTDLEQWKNIIDQIESEIRKLEQQPKTQQRNERLATYSKAAAQFWYFKNAWRNHVSHARASYDETQVLEILRAVESLMDHLSS